MQTLNVQTPGIIHGYANRKFLLTSKLVRIHQSTSPENVRRRRAESLMLLRGMPKSSSAQSASSSDSHEHGIFSARRARYALNPIPLDMVVAMRSIMDTRCAGGPNTISHVLRTRALVNSLPGLCFGGQNRFCAGGIGENARRCEAPVSLLILMASGGVGRSKLARPRLSSSESLTSGGVEGAEDGLMSIEGMVVE